MDFRNIDEGHNDNPEENLVFHYNREERLKKAPKIVQDYHSGKLTAYKPGLFKALVSTKSNRMIFFALIICLAVVIFTGLFNKPEKNSLNGVGMSVSAMSFDETVYVSLKFEEDRNYKKAPLPLTCSIEFLDIDKNVVEKYSDMVVFNGKEEYIRTTYHDYDILCVNAFVSSEDKSVKLTTGVSKH